MFSISVLRSSSVLLKVETIIGKWTCIHPEWINHVFTVSNHIMSVFVLKYCCNVLVVVCVL